MKQIKRIFILFVFGTFMSLGAIIVDSCQSDDTNTASLSNNLIGKMGIESKKAMAEELVVRPANNSMHRAANKNNALLMQKVYVDFPEGTPSSDIEKVSKLESLDDMMLLSHQTAAEFHFEKSDLTKDSIVISEDKAKKAIIPMVAESREYLYAKGFTKKDIDDMLKENNADETVLVSFVLTLIEREQLENKLAISKSYSSFFAIPARAEVDWGKAGNCALHALGVDIFYGLSQSTLKTWGVTAMKRAFATVAKKIVGPIGVAFFVGDFAWCYFN